MQLKQSILRTATGYNCYLYLSLGPSTTADVCGSLLERRESVTTLLERCNIAPVESAKSIMGYIEYLIERQKIGVSASVH